LHQEPIAKTFSCLLLFPPLGDDANTPNGRVTFKIKSGNELGLFKLEGGRNIAQVVAARSLKGFYGNYTIQVEAVDGGRPPNAVTKDFNICILDYNDNKVSLILLLCVYVSFYPITGYLFTTT